MTILPDADSYVASGAAADTNYGTQNTFRVDSSPVLEGLVKFTVSGVQGGITSAILRLNVKQGTSLGPNIYAADSNWSESTVTWNTRPARLGGVRATVGAVSSGTTVDINVTSIVGGNGTFTFDLEGRTADAAHFTSREGSASLRPRLIITSDPTGADRNADGDINAYANQHATANRDVHSYCNLHPDGYTNGHADEHSPSN